MEKMKRHKPPGSEFRKNKKKREKLVNSQRGSLLKFFSGAGGGIYVQDPPLNLRRGPPSDHINSYQNWKELEVRLLSGRTIDKEHQRIISEETQHWKLVLE